MPLLALCEQAGTKGAECQCQHQGWDIPHVPRAQTLLCVPWTGPDSPSPPLAGHSAVPGGLPALGVLVRVPSRVSWAW